MRILMPVIALVIATAVAGAITVFSTTTSQDRPGESERSQSQTAAPQWQAQDASQEPPELTRPPIQAHERHDFEDWSILCPPADNCIILQQHVQVERQQLIFAIALRRGEGTTLEATFYVAPSLRVADGLTLLVDEEEQLSLPFRLCRPGQCLANAMLSAELLSAILAAESLQASFFAESGQAMQVDISLAGFEAAIDALPSLDSGGR